MIYTTFTGIAFSDRCDVLTVADLPFASAVNELGKAVCHAMLGNDGIKIVDCSYKTMSVDSRGCEVPVGDGVITEAEIRKAVRINAVQLLIKAEN